MLQVSLKLDILISCKVKVPATLGFSLGTFKSINHTKKVNVKVSRILCPESLQRLICLILQTADISDD